MPSIEKRPGRPKRWQARYRGPDGKQHAQQFTRKIDAERFLATVETDKLRGAWVDPSRSRETVADWCEQWRAGKVDLRRSTLARLDTILRVHVLPEFGMRPLATLGNAEIRAWVARMAADGKSPTTVRKSYFALHDMLKAAVADRRLSYNPAQDVPLPVEHYDEQRFLSPTEVATLADVIHQRYRALVLVAVYGGLRFGELAALRRGRVDLLRARVTITETLVDVSGVLTFGPPKTKSSARVVPLPRKVMAQLEEHLRRYVEPGEDALVFTGTTGRPLRRARFRQSWWLPAVDAAGIKGLRFHDLRHTFVAVTIAAGADPKKVSVRAGHSSVAFTLDRYGHLYEDAEDQVTARLDAVIEAAPLTPSAQVAELHA